MKKIIGMALVLAMIFLFVACGVPYTPAPNPSLVMGEKFLTDLDYEQALLQFDQAITIDPKNPRGYLGKADALLHLDRQEDAAAALGDGAKSVPREQREPLQAVQAEAEKSIVDGYIGLSFAYEKLGWREIALALLKRVCEELPEESRLFIALERLMDLLDSEETTIAGQTTELYTGEPEEMPISAEEYAQVKAFLEEPFATLIDLYGRYAATDLAAAYMRMYGDELRELLGELWRDKKYGGRYEVHNIQKLSRRGVRQFVTAYQGMTRESWFAELKQLIETRDDIEWTAEVEKVAAKMFDSLNHSKWSLDGAEAIYRTEISARLNNAEMTDAKAFSMWVVKLRGEFHLILVLGEGQFKLIS